MIQKIKNWWGAENRASIFSLSNIKGFLQGMWRKEAGTTEHIQEQVKWRATQVDPVCQKNGYCRICGCDMEGKLYEDRGCSMGCYFNLLSKEDWEMYKLYLTKKSNDNR